MKTCSHAVCFAICSLAAFQLFPGSFFPGNSTLAYAQTKSTQGKTTQSKSEAEVDAEIAAEIQGLEKRLATLEKQREKFAAKVEDTPAVLRVAKLITRVNQIVVEIEALRGELAAILTEIEEFFLLRDEKEGKSLVTLMNELRSKIREAEEKTKK